jgi:DNA-binding transcriptional regulator YhcF (GntR family)
MTQVLPKKPTARGHVAAVLTEEILNRLEEKDFIIASEHQLCRQFSVSRVTVRLALSDLEHLGLIYRRHGKGTFAYGRTTRSGRSLAVLIESSDTLARAPLIEIMRGAQTVTASLRSALVLISSSPLVWQAHIRRSLMGVIILQPDLTIQELGGFKDWNIPFLFIHEARLATNFDFFSLGQRAAHALNNAALIGNSIEELKIEHL